MLAMVPVRRKSIAWILATALWNFILCLPFLVAFFVLTEDRDNDHSNQGINGANPNIWKRYNAKGTEIFPDGTQRFTNGDVQYINGTRGYAPRSGGDQNCFFIPWGYANWARWGFLALCIYWLCIIPFNMWVLKQRKQNKESRWTPWLTMLDCLVWVYSFGQWIYAIMALGNRSGCPDKGIKRLIWANVWISGILFGLELLIALILLLIAVSKLKKDLEARVGYVKGAASQFMGFEMPIAQQTTTTTTTTTANPVVVTTTQPRVV